MTAIAHAHTVNFSFGAGDTNLSGTLFIVEMNQYELWLLQSQWVFTAQFAQTIVNIRNWAELIR